MHSLSQRDTFEPIMGEAYPFTPLARQMAQIVNQLSSATVAYRYARYLRNPRHADRVVVELKYERIQVACNRAARTAIELLNFIYGDSQGLPHLLHTLTENSSSNMPASRYAHTEGEAIKRRIARLRVLSGYVNSVGAKFDTDGLLYSAEFDAMEDLVRYAITISTQLCRLLHFQDAFAEALHAVNENLKRPILT